MINLIPQTVRKSIIIEYWVRVATVGLFVTAVVSTAILIFNLPAYVLVTSQVEVFASDAANAAKRVEEYDFSAGALVKANAMSQKMIELNKVDDFTRVFELLESVQNEEIVLDGFEFARKDKAIAPVQVTGRASTRQALANFRDSLLQQPDISEVFLPISNLAKDKDIQFSISVTLKTES